MKTITIRNLTIGKGIPAICVPVYGKEENSILRETEAVLLEKPDLIEWRADWLDGMDTEFVLAILARMREKLADTPLLFTFRTKEEGGQKAVSKEEYIRLLNAVIHSGNADIIDIELLKGDETVLQLIQTAHVNHVYAIVSSHDFQKTPKQEEMVNRLRKMQELGADLSKLAVMPQSEEDVQALLKATEQMHSVYAECPIVTMSMSETGRISRYTGEKYGSAMTFASVSKASAPGQIPISELRELLTAVHQSLTEEKPSL